MFNLEIYKNTINNKMIGRVIYKRQDLTDLFIEALCQFEVAPGTYLTSLSKELVSLKCKQIFKNQSKPNNIWWNKWLLYTEGFKHCSKCKEVKTLSEYYKNEHRWDKLVDTCSLCSIAQSSLYRQKNPEKAKEWKQKNTEKVNNNNSKRRAFIKKAIPTYATPEEAIKDTLEILAIYTQCANKTLETGIKYHVDHIKPLSKGGLHTSNNLQILTATENMKKQAKWP